jgi:hypothetical protein
MPTNGKLEITIKINEFPESVRTVENAWKEFDLDCDGQIVTMNVKPKVFKKLEQAQESYPMWVAAIAGRMGEPTREGFILEQQTSRYLNASQKNQSLTQIHKQSKVSRKRCRNQ